MDEMARIRTIKPDFFKHEALFDAERDTTLPLRVAFAGLFTVADRAGRFHWRPRTLKLDCLPYDDVDFARVLDALATRGFIVKYEVDGEAYGYIPSWNKHQVINNREADSIIPSPNGNNDLTREARVEDASGTPLEHAPGEGKGKEGKGKDSCVAAGHTIEGHFDRFWSIYPKRKGGNPRHPAYLKFIAAVKAGADPESIIRAVKAYADECERLGKLGSEYVKQAQWWLNQKQWQDYAAIVETKDQAIAEFNKKVLVFEDTHQGKAWEESRRAERGVGVSWHDIRDPVTGRFRPGAYFDSEWPPGHSDKQAA